MAVEIPVTFEYKGKEYKAIFSDAYGSGNRIWHLSVDRNHWGQLIYSDRWGWQFYDQKEEMPSYSDYFGDAVMAWYE